MVDSFTVGDVLTPDLGGSATTDIVATTVLMNQPYADQGSYAAPTTRNCTARDEAS